MQSIDSWPGLFFQHHNKSSSLLKVFCNSHQVSFKERNTFFFFFFNNEQGWRFGQELPGRFGQVAAIAYAPAMTSANIPYILPEWQKLHYWKDDLNRICYTEWGH